MATDDDGVGFVESSALASPAAAAFPLLLCCSTASRLLVAERTAAVVAGVTPDARKASTAEASVEAISNWFWSSKAREKK